MRLCDSPGFLRDFSEAESMARRTVDLHPSDQSDRSIGEQMENMELSSGNIEEQPEASLMSRDDQASADEPMDQCVYFRID